MIILALDALDKNMVDRFNCKNLMQLEYGKTNISEFKLPRTIVLWSSFLTGKNMEKKIPIKGQWKFNLKVSETFFSFFNSYKAIDVPGFSFKQKPHEKERKLLKGFFNDENTIEDYDEVVWKIHEKNKLEFLNSLEDLDIIMGYFNLADAIGHLSFGNEKKMRDIYEELESITRKVKKNENFILVISDHGMKAVGRFGDHTNNGFYSTNKKLNLKEPKITDFYEIIKVRSHA